MEKRNGPSLRKSQGEEGVPPPLSSLREKPDDGIDEFVKSHLFRVYHLCFTLTQNKQKSERLTHKTFLIALQTFNDYQGKPAFHQWIDRLAVHLWKEGERKSSKTRFPLNFLRKMQNAPPIWPKDFDIPQTSNMDLIMPSSTRLKDGLTALNSLEPDQKILVVLRDLRGDSLDDISTLLGWSPDVVKTKLSQARVDLSDFYKGGV